MAPSSQHREPPGNPGRFRQAGLVLQGNFFTKESGQADFIQPTATADKGSLHLEARYNYEALNTGSLWLGWNLSWGSGPKLTLTPEMGGVFGAVVGLAPGVEWDLTWGPLEVQSQNEFLFDFTDWSASDYNYWAEVRLWLCTWLRSGVALQHTRAIETHRPAQWGPLLGVNVWRITVSAYWMLPGHPDEQYWLLSVGSSL
jgi:hypothetical protein